MNSNPLEESVLLHRLKEGDINAYVKIYNAYHTSLYAYVIKFLKIPELAEDVLQEVFLKIWEVRKRIDPELSFKAYIYRISRNCVFKLLKKIASEDELRLQVLFKISATVEQPDIKIQWQQYQQFLSTAIGHLPPQRQIVFQMCRLENKKYDEVAAELGISRNTVKEHMVLAVRFIKEYLFRHYKIELILAFLLSRN